MEFLDAVIGFAVVIGIFSGAVTIFLEIVWRLIRIRKGNMIQILKQLDEELEHERSVPLEPSQRWNLMCSILNNPMKSGEKLAHVLPHSDAMSMDRQLPVRFVSIFSKFAPSAGTSTTESSNERATTAIAALDRKNALSGMFEKVSAEHVARRYAEFLSEIGIDKQDLNDALKLIIRKFETTYSCMSAEFKRRSKVTSIGIGVVAALVFNINGLRVLDNFIANPELSKAFATELDSYERQVLDEIDKAREDLEKARLEHAEPDSTSTESLEDAVDKLNASVTSLSDAGVPIGHRYPPHCNLFGKATCDPAAISNGRNILVEWLLLVFTGALLGLGAPFWFDVAKRLASVRTMFGGKPGSGEANTGRDANGSTEKRNEIAKNIVADAGGKKKMNVFQIYSAVPDKARFQLQVTDPAGKIACRANLDDSEKTIANWRSNDIKDDTGVEHELRSDKSFYTATLDLTYLEVADALVEIKIVDDNGDVHGDPWQFSMKGQKSKTNSAITTILMA